MMKASDVAAKYDLLFQKDIEEYGISIAMTGIMAAVALTLAEIDLKAGHEDEPVALELFIKHLREAEHRARQIKESE